MDEQQDTRPGESSLPATEEFYRSMHGAVTPPDEETTALLDIEQGRLGGNYGSHEASEARKLFFLFLVPLLWRRRRWLGERLTKRWRIEGYSLHRRL
jgi:hypothetical protein